MLSGLTAAEAAVDGARVVEVTADALIPTPSTIRRDPQCNAASESGTSCSNRWQPTASAFPHWQSPADAFNSRWPGLIPADTTGTHVLICGHRHRAAALATNTTTLPVTVDDAVLDAPDGGMFAMYEENAGREDLTPIAEAEILDDVHVSQRELSSLLGIA